MELNTIYHFSPIWLNGYILGIKILEMDAAFGSSGKTMEKEVFLNEDLEW